MVYHLLLPENLIVQPVDWRQFAYDHDKVRDLLSICVRDNTKLLVFTPNSDEAVRSAEDSLKLALGDLSSIFDIISVRCERESSSGDTKAGILTTIEGEHKNGERRTYRFQTELP